MGYSKPVRIVASALRSTNGNSGLIPIVGANLNLIVDVSVISGAVPTLTFEVEWTSDAGTTWFKGEPVDTFTEVNSVTKKMAKRFSVKAPGYRLVWTITGTLPEYTFSVDHFEN